MYHGYYPNPYYSQWIYPTQYPYEQQPYFPPADPFRNQPPAPQDDSERQRDQGGQPYVVNIEQATERNRAFRRTLWTGQHLQLTLMRILPGEDIGLELHPNTDQFLRIEDGHGVVQMGDRRNQLNYQRRFSEDDVILIPAGKWHNIRNTGRSPLTLYSIYAPPEHPRGTVHQTKQEAMHQHNHNHHHQREADLNWDNNTDPMSP